MSKATDVYDALAARLTAVFPSHTRLVNPYDIIENNKQDLEAGLGLQIGPGVNTKRLLSCQLSVARDFIVKFTRIVRANQFDITSRVATEKQLFEDQKLLIDDVEGSPRLGDPTAVTLSAFESDSGLEFIFADSNAFIKLDTIIRVEYIDSLT